MNKRLSGKVAFITGGGSWIGKEIAKVFANEAAKVFIVGRNEKKLIETVNEIIAAGGEAAYSQANVSNATEMQIAMDKAIAQYQKIDILVQNAGVYPSAMLEEMSLKEWQEVIDINLTGSFITLKSAIPILKQQTQARVIFISSIAGEEMGYAGFAHYTASKAGMNGLMRTAALELAKYNITVNSIDPGNIFNGNASQAELDSMLNNIPLKRLGKPVDVANLALFLASNESGFITGQHLVVDGGETIG